MLKRHTQSYIRAFGILLFVSMSVFGQPNDAQRPTQEELTNQKINELLKHPTLVQLRLLSMPRDFPRASSTDTPAPYRVDDWISFRLMVSQSVVDEVALPTYRNPYYEVRPVLMRDGEIIPYGKQAETATERAEATFPPASFLKLKAGTEYELQQINLKDWYESLAPGRYQLIIRRRFHWKGDWAISTTVYFEVQSISPPSPIPDGVAVELVPEGPNLGKKMSRLGADTVVRVFTANKSDKAVKVNTVDFFYAVRPQLFKDGVLMPYGPKVAEVLISREKNPRLIQMPDEIFLEPTSRTGLTYLRLVEWYGPLLPGSYRLTVRQRFEIDGPWTPPSAELVFEVTPE